MATQVGGSGFAAATSVSKSISVTAKPQTISFAPPTSLTLDQSPYTLVASSSSGLPVTITSSSASVCTVVGSVLTLVSAGTCSLVATQVGGSGYGAALAQSRSVSLSKLSQVINFSAPSSLLGNQTPFLLGASSSVGLPISYKIYGNLNVCHVSVQSGAAYLVMDSAGTCNVSATQAGDFFYQAAVSVAKSILLLAASDTVTVNQVDVVGGSKISADAFVSLESKRAYSIQLSGITQNACSLAGGILLNVINTGTCSFKVIVAASGIWQAVVYTVNLTAVAPPVQIKTSGTFANTGNNLIGPSLGVAASFNTGTYTNDLAQSSKNMTFVKYIQCPSGTTLTSNQIPSACATLSQISWFPFENCSRGSGCFDWYNVNRGVNIGTGTTINFAQNPIYAVEAAQILYGGTIYNYVRWDFLDGKFAPTFSIAPSISRVPVTGGTLALNLGDWQGSPSSVYPTPKFEVQWGYCLAGTSMPVLDGRTCWNFTSLDVLNGSATLDLASINSSFLTNKNWVIYSMLVASNSYGSKSTFAFWGP